MVADNYHDDNGVLKNKLGLTDRKALRAAEYAIVRQALPDALAFAQSESNLSLNTLKGIHQHLFGDVYEWAGKTRTVPLYKGETAFAPVSRINDDWFQGLMDGFNRAVRKEPDRFRRHLGELWGRLNWLHPFPEGNGRSSQLFLTIVARRHGHDIDWSRVDPDHERAAAIAAIQTNFSPYEVLLIGPLTALDPAQPLAQGWIETDKGDKNSG